jgi:predicted AAA+ superfamily ATPase
MTAGPLALAEPERRGRVFELAVGAELLQLPGELFYWREKSAEVDFVLRYQGRLHALEVKSGRKKSGKGLEAFMKRFPDASPVIVDPDNFVRLSADPKKFLAGL